MTSKRKENEFLIVVEWQEAIKGIFFSTKHDENWK